MASSSAMTTRLPMRRVSFLVGGPGPDYLGSTASLPRSSSWRRSSSPIIAKQRGPAPVGGVGRALRVGVVVPGQGRLRHERTDAGIVGRVVEHHQLLVEHRQLLAHPHEASVDVPQGPFDQGAAHADEF